MHLLDFEISVWLLDTLKLLLFLIELLPLGSLTELNVKPLQDIFERFSGGLT